jgi:hypothetical protein
VVFPWNDVLACFRAKLNSKEYAGHLPCPHCGAASEQLIWISFSSPDWTWKNLCGRSGPLSICPNCRTQVQFVCHIMS